MTDEAQDDEGEAMPGQAITENGRQVAREAFLAKLAQGFSITAAVQASALSRSWFYRQRDADPAFAAAWDEALDAGTDGLEDEALRRGRDGVEEPIVAMGRIAKDDAGNILTRRVYSDQLLLATLKRRRPEAWKDRAAVDAQLSGKVGHEHSADEAFAMVAAALGGYAARPDGGADAVDPQGQT